MRRVEQWQASIAAESEEMQMAASVVALQIFGHDTKPPRVKPTRGAPAFLVVPVYYNNGILSSMEADKRKEQERAWASRPKLMAGAGLALLLAGFPPARGQRSSKPDLSSHLSLLGFRLEKSTFADVRDKLGAAKIGQCLHEVEPISYIGYISQKPEETKILFESNRFDPPFELSGFRVVAGSRSTSPCQLQYKTSTTFGSRVQTGGGLKLGLTKTELAALLDSPGKVSGNRLTFERWSKRPMTKTEIDQETQTFKAPVTRPFWDVHDTINVVLSESKIAEFEVRRTVTY
jgi:hypothetical protein